MFKNKIDKILPSDILHIVLVSLLLYLQPLVCKFPESKSFCLSFTAVSAVVTGSDTMLCQHLLNEELDCMGVKGEKVLTNLKFLVCVSGCYMVPCLRQVPSLGG